MKSALLLNTGIATYRYVFKILAANGMKETGIYR